MRAQTIVARKYLEMMQKNIPNIPKCLKFTNIFHFPRNNLIQVINCNSQLRGKIHSIQKKEIVSFFVHSRGNTFVPSGVEEKKEEKMQQGR